MTTEPKSISSKDLRSIPPADSDPETSGFEAAAEAAGLNGDPSSSSDEPQEPELEPELEPEHAPAPDPDAALVLFEILLGLTVHATARRLHVPIEDVAALARLDAGERQLLAMWSPHVAPFLGTVGENSPKVAAAAFGVFGVLILTGRIRDVKARAPRDVQPEPVTPRDEAPRDPHEPQPVNDLEHKLRWQRAADAVPPGLEIVDTGAFPSDGARFS